VGGLLLALVVALASPDAVVARAVALLEPLGIVSAAPIVVVHRQPMMHGIPQRRAVAATDGSTIYLFDDTDPFKRATKGDAIALAAALAHEAYHVAHGPAEGPAYVEQLRVLEALHARPKDVQVVEQARDAVAGKN
jgi:hypothetical protein